MTVVRGFVTGHWQLLALAALCFALWTTQAMYPLRMLVVLFHEISHGVAALLTGGSIERIELSVREGGVIWTRGGSGFLISSAGYLGSLICGVLLFVFALRTAADKWLLGGCGAVILIVALFYVRDGFTLLYCGIVGAAMVAAAWWLRAEVADLVLRVIGLVSMAYVPWDIWDDTIRDKPGQTMSDAAAIAARSFGTEAMWGGVWLLISIFVIGVVLRYGFSGPSNISLRGSQE